MTSTPAAPPATTRSPNGADDLLAAPVESGPALGQAAEPFATSRELEHAVLHLLAAEDGPLGSGSLLEQLQSLGYAGSEPTVGRLLRSLDRRGLTCRVSNRGRALTEAGRARLRQLGEAAARRRYERELLGAIRPTTIDDLLDVLVARRALEREIARLAAEYATADEIAELEAAITDQRRSLAEVGVAIEADVRFHTLLAQASRNRVLAAAVDLIWRDRQASIRLDVILKQTEHHWVVGHERIVRALRRRDPAAAERAMREHIDSLIADIRRYRDRVEPASSAGRPPAALVIGPTGLDAMPTAEPARP